MPPIIMTTESYRLPNGCLIYPGGRVRLPAEQIWLIPEEDIKKFELTLSDDYSYYSEVIERKKQC